MPLSLILAVAVTALKRNLLRTLLTMLGMVIGVGAVITIVALGAGASDAIEDNVSAAGTNLIIVSAGNRTFGGVRLGMGASSRLTPGDADAIRRAIPGVRYLSPGVRTRQQLVVSGQNWQASVEGASEDLPHIRSWRLRHGAWFGRSDVELASKVTVIGSLVRDVLFGAGANPVGRDVRIGTQMFRVVGVLEPKGQSAGGEDQDDAVFVPYTAAQKKLMGVGHLRNITISAASADGIGRTAAAIAALLRVRHDIAPGAPDDFRVRTLDDMIAVRTRTTRTMTLLLTAIAAVSLVVGGIGVMNIMLVSVTERTREIGLRVALGARGRDVLLQFLVEAVLLSLAGGLLGVGAGVLASNALTALFAWPASVPLPAAAGAFGFSALVGIFFGWYPARKAAGTDPIEALRFE
jgi:putative ABC transport system permease protein